MGKVIVSTMVTLDGVMEAPEKWSMQFWNHELDKWALDELLASDALLLGRVTYQGFADYWPSATDNEGLANRMNGLPKYLVSTTLEEPLEWDNTTLIKGNVAEEVANLKQEPGRDMLVLASADLVHTLMQHNLIDEYRIRVTPVVVGSGKRLFTDRSDVKILKLVQAKAFGSGVIVLTYRPAKDAEG
jgi:dihydrofolate reductase